MTNFIGDFTSKIDAKGRISFPSSFKKQMNTSAKDTFILKKDIFENCLILYTNEEWERQVNLIREKINPYKKEHNIFIRNFYKDTAEVTLDTNNRLLIPKRLLDIMNIDKEVYLVGLDSKIEIWSIEEYEKINNADVDFAGLAEKIFANDLNT
jgi:MraZ protein